MARSILEVCKTDNQIGTHSKAATRLEPAQLKNSKKNSPRTFSSSTATIKIQSYRYAVRNSIVSRSTCDHSTSGRFVVCSDKHQHSSCFTYAARRTRTIGILCGACGSIDTIEAIMQILCLQTYAIVREEIVIPCES